VSRYRITHSTTYRYSRAVSLCHSEAHLVPRAEGRQRLYSWNLETRPALSLRHERDDFFGNRTTYFSIEVPHDELEVVAACEVAVLPPAPPQGDQRPWEEARDAVGASTAADDLAARQFLLDSPFVAASATLRAYAEKSFSPGRPLLEAVADLSSRIHREFTYDPHFSTVATPVEEVLAHRRGVCQDFAHLTIGCLRSLGLAARYVSGYLETDPPPGQARLEGADASHAWLSVFVPGAGWWDFDPTNDQSPDGRYIVLAWGRDYGDVTPLKGVLLGGGQHDLTVAVDVERLEGEGG
jgi:transglutaminase-like putative cysteine protease